MNKKRTLGVLAATFAAAALPMVAASPAAATPTDCKIFLRNVGYTVGPKIEAACNAGADPTQFNPWGACYLLLANIGVKPSDAATACSEAW